jgi:hypothetical protein
MKGNVMATLTRNSVMSKSGFVILGIVLVILGGLALGWKKISYTTRETVVDVGAVKVMADNQKDLPLSPILGGIALAGGVGLIVMGVRK